MSYCSGCDTRHPGGATCPPSLETALDELRRANTRIEELEAQLRLQTSATMKSDKPVGFFVPEDFVHINKTDSFSTYQVNWIATQANAKLERKGRTVIGSPETNWDEAGNRIETHKALLINIELVEKCAHPNIKIKGRHYSGIDHFEWQCKCGVKVQPVGFEEV